IYTLSLHDALPICYGPGGPHLSSNLNVAAFPSVCIPTTVLSQCTHTHTHTHTHTLSCLTFQSIYPPQYSERLDRRVCTFLQAVTDEPKVLSELPPSA